MGHKQKTIMPNQDPATEVDIKRASGAEEVITIPQVTPPPTPITITVPLFTNIILVPDAASPTPGRGIVSVTGGDVTLTGIATEFTHVLNIGSSIIVNGEQHSVKTIDSDTSLTVEGPWINSANQVAYSFIF